MENHLNYVHRPKGVLSEDECWGLAALYNSRLLDSYFRCINGNTQVSATELRAMPLPTASTITALGRRVRRMADPLATLDDAVMAIAAPQKEGQTTLGKRVPRRGSPFATNSLVLRRKQHERTVACPPGGIRASQGTDGR